MQKKVLVISTSLRKDGNSDTLAQEFIRGANDSGNDVEKISLINKHISFCKGCLVCQKTGNCILKDDANEIVEKMKNADVIVFATPIYFYEMSGQMKTLLDRSNPLYISDYQFRDIYLLATAADNDLETFDTVVKGMDGWIKCFEDVTLKGVVKGFGADEYGSIQENVALITAYEMGKSIN